jgi:hypothetical protein
MIFVNHGQHYVKNYDDDNKDPKSISIIKMVIYFFILNFVVDYSVNP